MTHGFPLAEHWTLPTYPINARHELCSRCNRVIVVAEDQLLIVDLLDQLLCECCAAILGDELVRAMYEIRFGRPAELDDPLAKVTLCA